MEEEKEESIKRFIITDPFWLLNEYDFHDQIQNNVNIWKNRNQPENETRGTLPFNTTYKKTNELITIYKIGFSLNGYNTQIFRDQEIQIDSGVVCIAENRNGWQEKTGVLLETLTEAKIVFPYIIKKS